jgi:hypothetical protein
VLLVPRQLQRVGMTGSVPYYGGRLAPAQAYEAAHAQPVAVPDQDAPKAGDLTRRLAALDDLRGTGVISDAEYADLRARVLG